MAQGTSSKLHIAAIGDLHVRETSEGEYQGLFNEISKKADVLLLCGDLTDLGLISEAEVLVKELQHCTIPVLAVFGNHDYHNDKQHEIAQFLQQNKVIIIHGIDYVLEKNGKKYGFTGAKGYGGGFRPNMWGRFGEREQKAFYDAIEQEVETLEIGLNRLVRATEIDKYFVALHYTPIRDTLQGELQELYPFLGSSRLEEVINRYQVAAVFHGHSHYGSPNGKTTHGVPVYNVAFPVMKRLDKNVPYRIVEF